MQFVYVTAVLFINQNIGLNYMRNTVYCVGLTLIRKYIEEKWLRKLPHQPRNSVAENVTWQTPKIKTHWTNQQPQMVAEYEADEAMGEEAVTKEKVDEEDISNEQKICLQYVILSAKWNNSERL